MTKLHVFWVLCLGLIGCTPLPAVPDSPPSAGVSQADLGDGLKIYALRTGWVNVKQAHRELNVPDFLAIPAIFLGGWSEWMPIITYVVIHPEGVFLVDTGPSPHINAPDYYACDRANGLFYQRNLRFALPEGESLRERLGEIGVAPAAVKGVLISHFHADHVGGVADVPQAIFYTGPGNWPQHLGALTCRLPAGFEPRVPDYQPLPVGPIPVSFPLTQDGRLAVVPLPGHTPGHAGLVVHQGNRHFLMAGDATFDIAQTLREGVTGASQDLTQARATQALLKQWLAQGTVLLPAHDEGVFTRLAALTQ
ncbi:MAG: MBL fold metallo-hydrolase [Candidatus Sericytochromatia bacterium]